MSRLNYSDHAMAITKEVTGMDPIRANRFATGLAHHVYEVFDATGASVVVRLSSDENRYLLAGGCYWNEVLRPLGVPLPRLLASSLDGEIPSMVVERIPGKDLGEVYCELSISERRNIACEVARVQAAVGTMENGPGYGYFAGPDSGFSHQSWAGVVQELLDRSAARIRQAGAFSGEAVQFVRAQALQLDEYFHSIPSLPFLDDTTTKNVLIHEGKLSGIVDVDEVCFGDALMVVALTRMSLIERGEVMDYIDAWCEEIRPSAAQKRALDFYTLLYCVDFMGEVGTSFNGLHSTEDRSRVARLQQCFESMAKEFR